MDPLGTKPFAVSPDLPPLSRERRRRVRLKVHTPAYVRFTGSSGELAPDLSEIVDISEDGMAIQTSSPLDANRNLDLCLDLSETKTYIRTNAQVVWSNRFGRTGLRFPEMPDASLHELRQWLFFNAIVACANHAPAPAQPADLKSAKPDPKVTAKPASALEEFEAAAPPDYTSILIALVAVKREVEAIGPNLDAALNLIARRAQTFTRATGAAIALSQGEEMICCASAGSDAPGVGVRLQVGSGFSGECVRSGRLLRCDDSETDSHVDRESCRLLGIRSMVAVPVRLGETVVGLLEVFSPKANNFGPNDEVVLQRLAETVLAAVNRAARASADKDVPVETQSRPVDALRKGLADADKPSSRSHRVFLIAAGATLILVLLWLTVPWIMTWSSSRGRVNAQPPPKPQVSAPQAHAASVADVATVEDLRKLAEQGDATAQFALGRHYATGDEVKQDYTEAARWFGLAADQGYVPAQSALGAYYWSGRGVPKDLNKAYFWSVLAQTGGDESSKYLVAAISSSMSRRQIFEMQQQAGDWLKQHRFISSKPNQAR